MQTSPRRRPQPPEPALGPALVVDYGGVLTTPVRDSLTAWLAADRIVAESLTVVLGEWLGRHAAPGSPIHRLETGELAGPEFERQFAGRLRTEDGQPVRATGLLDRMFAGMAPDPVMLDLLRQVRANGIRTALLSNSWANRYPMELLAELCDVIVISSEVGLRKPDPRIFDLVLRRLGVPAAAAVFLDDAEPNVLGARAAGLQAILHREPAATRQELADLGLLRTAAAVPGGRSVSEREGSQRERGATEVVRPEGRGPDNRRSGG